MTWAYITEFAEMQVISTAGQVVQAALFPELAKYQISNTGASAQGPPFQARTKFIRINTDAACSIEVGSNPIAVNTANRMSPNSTEYFGVEVNQAHLVAVVANT